MTGASWRGKLGFRPMSLNAVNFLLADVSGALGPYLNVFLVTQQHWSQAAVGLVTVLDGLIALVLRTPIGALIDATAAKCGLLIAALAAVTIFCLPSFWPVLIANSMMTVAGDVFGPAVAAITLGLVGRGPLARRMGRNAAFDHAGNAPIAVMAGAVGYLFSQSAVFLLVPVFAAVVVLFIPYGPIDLERVFRCVRSSIHFPTPRRGCWGCNFWTG